VGTIYGGAGGGRGPYAIIVIVSPLKIILSHINNFILEYRYQNLTNISRIERNIISIIIIICNLPVIYQWPCDLGVGKVGFSFSNLIWKSSVCRHFKSEIAPLEGIRPTDWRDFAIGVYYYYYNIIHTVLIRVTFLLFYFMLPT